MVLGITTTTLPPIFLDTLDYFPFTASLPFRIGTKEKAEETETLTTQASRSPGARPVPLIEEEGSLKIVSALQRLLVSGALNKRAVCREKAFKLSRPPHTLIHRPGSI